MRRTQGHQKNPDIKRILRNKDLTAVFQQVVYITRKKVCGLEGLIRGVDAGRVVSPYALFSSAQKKGLTLELDRLCRDKVLEAFGRVHPENKDKLLFLNLDASVLDSACCSGYLSRQAQTYGVDPGHIVIEINEAKVQSSAALKEFIIKYRGEGFLIALDDVGAGFSNLDRIPIVKPDIIKIDLGLVRGIHSDYHKQEVFKSLIRLSTQIGAMVVAEGVETEREAVEVLRLGANMIQGYYFSKPCELCESPFENERIEMLANSFRDYILKNLREEQRAYQQAKAIVKGVICELTASGEPSEKLPHIVGRHEAVECAYVLDEQGIQCSETVFGSGRGDARSLIFDSARPGADHSMKRYFYQLTNNKRESYMTEPYVSLATGNLCVTFAETFKNADNKKYILCMDFCEEER